MRGGRDMLADMLVEVMGPSGPRGAATATSGDGRPSAGEEAAPSPLPSGSSSCSSLLGAAQKQRPAAPPGLSEAGSNSSHVYPALCPAVMCSLATRVCPF